MKKLIIPVLAILVAFSSSAFTSKKTVKLLQPALFWYSINGSNQLQAQLNSTVQTKDDSMLGGANQITDCEDSESDPCIVGYESPQTLGSPVTVADDEHVVRKDQ